LALLKQRFLQYQETSRRETAHMERDRLESLGTSQSSLGSSWIREDKPMLPSTSSASAVPNPAGSKSKGEEEPQQTQADDCGEGEDEPEDKRLPNEHSSTERPQEESRLPTPAVAERSPSPASASASAAERAPTPEELAAEDLVKTSPVLSPQQADERPSQPPTTPYISPPSLLRKALPTTASKGASTYIRRGRVALSV